jgi:hypothetical protein
MDLVGHFGGLLSRIEPSAPHVTRAKKAHELLRKRLEEDEEVGKAHQATFLAGSYARHTAIHDIKDVDVVCILDVDKDVTEPLTLLRWLEGALLRYYDEVRLQGRSLGVTTPGGFSLDVVPGTPQFTADGPLWIPDREAKQWVTAHPKGQLEFATTRNAATGGFYVRTVKIMKHWRDRLPTAKARPKSYVLETLVADTIGTLPPESHAAAVVKVLEGIRNRYQVWVGTGIVPPIPDPGYSTVSVSKRWEPAEFDAFMSRVESAAVTARQAWEEADQARSVTLWRRLLGDDFAPAQ